MTDLDVVTLWRPTGRAELDLVAASGWREWPARLPDQPIFYPVLSRAYATRIARDWNVPQKGVGFVTRFDVRRDFLDRYAVQRAGSVEHLEYWIPAEELDEFNAHIVGAIQQVAEYAGPVADAEFEAVARKLGRPLPDAWRTYLQGRSWLRSGLLDSGECVRLYPPSETTARAAAWGEATPLHPGLWFIGDSGSAEYLALDLRRDPAPVLLLNNASRGWDDAIFQAPDVGAVIARIEDGSFEFTF